MTGNDLYAKLVQCQPTDQEFARISQVDPQSTVAAVRKTAEAVARHKGEDLIHDTLIKSLARDFPTLET